MAYTNDYWDSIQIRAVDPTRACVPSETNKLIRCCTHGYDLILEGGLLTKKCDLVVTVQPGKYVKDNVYIEFITPVDIDFTDPSNYVINTNFFCGNPVGSFWIVLDYVWKDSNPASVATFKIAKNISEITSRHLVLGQVDMIKDPNTGQCSISLITYKGRSLVDPSKEGFVVPEPNVEYPQRAYVSAFSYWDTNCKPKRFHGGFTSYINTLCTPLRYRYDLVAFDLNQGIIVLVQGSTTYVERQNPLDVMESVPTGHIGLAVLEIYDDRQRAYISSIINISGRINNNTSSCNARNSSGSSNPCGISIVPTDPVSDRIIVNEFTYISPIDMSSFRHFIGGIAGPFNPVTNEDLHRYDLVTITDSGEIKIYQGCEHPIEEDLDPYSACPSIPGDELAIGIIHITEDSNVEVNFFDIIVASECLNKSFYRPALKRFKDDWQDLQTTWILDFYPDAERCLIYRNGLLENPSAYTIVDNVVTFKRPLRQGETTTILATELDYTNVTSFNTFPYSESKTDWDGQSDTWVLSRAINPELPSIVSLGGDVLTQGIDYHFESSGRVIRFHFTPTPNSNALIVAYPILNTVFQTGFREFIKDDWNCEEGEDIWELPVPVDENFIILVFVDGKEVHDYTVIDPTHIRFSRPPCEYTKLILLVRNTINCNGSSGSSDSCGLIQGDIAQYIVTKYKSDIDPNTYYISLPYDYMMGNHQLKVYLNGVRLAEAEDYYEVDSQTIAIDSNLYNLMTPDSRLTIEIPYLADLTGSRTANIGSVYRMFTKADFDANLRVNLQTQYVMGNNQLEVFLNGQKLFINEDYLEIDNSTIQLSNVLYNNMTSTCVITVYIPYII